MGYKLALTGKVLLNFDSSSNYMHKDLLIVQVVFQTFCIYSQAVEENALDGFFKQIFHY